mgnify:CR=1 FL=1
MLHNGSVTTRPTDISIDEYLRERLMPVEGSIPHISGIEMYGNSIPVESVGGDLFEYINFQQRYDIDVRIHQALNLSKEFLDPLPPGATPRNSVDDHVEWMKSRPDYRFEMEVEYRSARSSEQVRVAEALNELHSTAGVLLVDAQGHGLISAKIASTVHDTFHAFMLSELDHHGTTTPELLKTSTCVWPIPLQLVTHLVISEENVREIATMLYGEVHPYGYFRFVNFGHPPPLVFSAEYRKFVELDKDRMVQFLPLGLQIPSDHPDRKRYFSMQFRPRPANSSDVAEITLMSPGDILFLYTDGVYDGSDAEERKHLEVVMQEHYSKSARDICTAVLEHATKKMTVCGRLDKRIRLTTKQSSSLSESEGRVNARSTRRGYAVQAHITIMCSSVPRQAAA